MNKPLQQMRCEPCRGGVKPLSAAEADALLGDLPGWRRLTENGIDRIEREFKLADFDDACGFAMQLADLAREQDHHPAILVEYGKAAVRWWTHKIKGLHLNDFIMAAKTDAVAEKPNPAGN